MVMTYLTMTATDAKISNDEERRNSEIKHLDPQRSHFSIDEESNSDNASNNDQQPFVAEEGSLSETLAGLAGNVLEWYDFAVFGYFSDAIANVFFPHKEDSNVALIQSFAIFGGAFFMRPFGGLVMGYIGDKFGRKRALETSIFLMAFPTFAMGCLPGYDTVGWFAVFLLAIVRMLQGLSVGGQLVSSLVFTLEKHDRRYWGFYGSLVLGTANVGTLLGGIVGSIMRETLTDEQLESWGWRIPFLLGIVVSLSGFYLKNHCSEVHLPPQKDVNPIKEAFSRENRRSLMSSSFVPMLWSAGFYLSFVWMAIYMKDLVEPSVPNAFVLNSLSLFFSCCLFFPVSGWISDKYGRVAVMTVGGLGVIWLGPLMLYVANYSKQGGIFFTQCILGIFLSFWGAPMCAWLVERFPQEVRLTAVAIGYNIAQAFMGGFAPAIATLMVDKVDVLSPGIIYIVVGIIALIGLHCAPKDFDSYLPPTDEAPQTQTAADLPQIS